MRRVRGSRCRKGTSPPGGAVKARLLNRRSVLDKVCRSDGSCQPPLRFSAPNNHLKLTFAVLTIAGRRMLRVTWGSSKRPFSSLAVKFTPSIPSPAKIPANTYSPTNIPSQTNVPSSTKILSPATKFAAPTLRLPSPYELHDQTFGRWLYNDDQREYSYSKSLLH